MRRQSQLYRLTTNCLASSGKNKIFVPGYNKILDPSSDFIQTWNHIFLFMCFVALFIDPLYFYVPKIVYGTPTSCIGTDRHLAITVTFFRSISDLLYSMHIIIKFRTAYINPSSTLRVFGGADLITDPKEIAWQYLRSEFIVDSMAALPLPQILVWFVIPAIKYSTAENNNNILVLIVLAQYFPRLYLTFSLTYETVKTTGVVLKTAWQGAAYNNILIYMIASHVLGAIWYLLSVDRQTACWKSNCKSETGCNIKFLDCDVAPNQTWASTTAIFNNCDATIDSPIFDYGMFQLALSNQAPGQRFLMKYFYSLWWGLHNLSCFGQTITASTYIGETLYCIFLAVLGFVLFAHLIGSVQIYLHSTTVRVEEWKLKQRETEQWTRHRQLSNELQERVRRFIQYKWLATRGVNEEAMLQALPADLCRDIKRYLCLGLVRRVPFFSQMDDQLLDAICERLVSSLCTEGTYIVREGDTLTEMLFIIRGKLESSTTNGGRTGFFNSTTLKSVKALIEVEAFVLQAEDLKFVATQFRRLHSKRLQYTYRNCSLHGRIWAACFIQGAWRWRRYKSWKMARDLSMSESFSKLEHGAHLCAPPVHLEKLHLASIHVT
uniref:Cyclic nucleotide-binding domain-containing protein n=1 Tax=Leersia perrieri TaxID=77586 RepID=A0A0D9VLZ9_9ORYZ